MPNAIIDLANGDVFELRMTLEAVRLVALPIVRQAKDALARTVWDVMTQVSARLVNAEHFSHLFDLLSEAGDLSVLCHAFRVLFGYWGRHEPIVKSNRQKLRRSISELPRSSSDGLALKKDRRFPPGTLNRLARLDQENPQADGLPRYPWFRWKVKDLIKKKECKNVEMAVRQVFEIFDREIQYGIMLSQGIDCWVKKFKPAPFTQLLQGITLQSETIFSQYPSVQCLSSDVTTLLRDFGSLSIRSQCRWAKVAGSEISHAEEREEAEYWTFRLSLWTPETSESDSASSSLLSGASTRSMGSFPRRSQDASDHSESLSFSTSKS